MRRVRETPPHTMEDSEAPGDVKAYDAKKSKFIGYGLLVLGVVAVVTVVVLIWKKAAT